MKCINELVGPSDLVVLREAYERMSEEMRAERVDVSLRLWEFDADDAQRRMNRYRIAEDEYRQRAEELDEYLRSL